MKSTNEIDKTTIVLVKDRLFDLYRSYSDACSMCSHCECDKCNLDTFRDDIGEVLKLILEREPKENQKTVFT